MKTKHYRAAGGVVLDSRDRVLMIERDVPRDSATIHEVRLPKGHVEEGETDREAAVRETCEESGYCDLDVVADLGEARSEYAHKNKQYVRDEHYFLMRLRSATHVAQDVDPESEEALFQPTWAESILDAQQKLTYETEREFARRALDWMRQAQQAQQQQ